MWDARSKDRSGDGGETRYTRGSYQDGSWDVWAEYRKTAFMNWWHFISSCCTRCCWRAFSVTCLSSTLVIELFGWHTEAMCLFLDYTVPPLDHFGPFYLNTHNGMGQKMHWKSRDVEKNWAQSIEGGSISMSSQRCQDASTGCKCWHVTQPWTTAARQWCKREKKTTLRILITMWMSVNRNVWHTAKDSPWGGQRGGLVGTPKLYTHNKVLSVWRRSS